MLAAYDKVQTTNESHSSGWSLGIGGTGTGFNYTRTNQNGTGDGSAASTSLLSANAGSLKLSAGNDPSAVPATADGKTRAPGTITVQGADLLAKDKISLSGNAVDLQAVQDTTASTYHMDSQSVALGTVRLTGTVGSVLQEGLDRTTQGSSGNDRLDAARGLKLGYDLYKNAGQIVPGVGNLSNLGNAVASGDPAALKDAGAGTSIGISVSAQFSQSHADSQSASSTARGSNLQGGSIAITAREADIAMAGAKLQATDISLDAAKNLNLGAAVSTASTQSSSGGSSFGGGVTLGGGQQNGLSFQVNASTFSGNANGSETTHDNTQIVATNTLSLKSGADTQLIGAQVAGKPVSADIGGNLKIESLQDQSDYHSESSSAGFSVSVCVPPICAGTTCGCKCHAARGLVSKSRQAVKGSTPSSGMRHWTVP